MNKKTGIVIGSILFIMGIIICFFASLSFNINKSNEEIFDKDVYVVIYQYEIKDTKINKTEIYRCMFTEDLFLEKDIYNASGGFNKLVIKDGVIKVYESNCKDHLCEGMIISKDNILNTTDIVCMPNRLIITLEVAK